MTTHYLTIMYDGTESTTVRTTVLDDGRLALNLADSLDLHGPRGHLVALFSAALEALQGPDGAEVVPLRRPGKRRVTIGVDQDQLDALTRALELYPKGEITPMSRLVGDILAAAAAEPELECTCVRYHVNPDDPSEGTDVLAESRWSCPVHGPKQEVGPGAA